MTEPCPTAGYTCVDTLVARVHAVIDQGTGMQAVVKGHMLDVTVGQMLEHYRQLCALLSAAVDEYTQGHGVPPMVIDLKAVQWLVDSLRM